MKKLQSVLSDCELIAAYIKGEESAFEVLLRRHKNKVYSSILMIVKDQVVAEDLLQETFIKAVTMIRAGKYNEEGKFLPWVSRIAHNMAIDFFRKQKRHPMIQVEEGNSVFDTADFAEPSFEDLHIEQETFARLRRLIQKLPDTQREVLMMRHYMNMSFQEIAEATNVSINTALGRMRYALINLRKQLNQSNDAYVTGRTSKFAH